ARRNSRPPAVLLNDPTVELDATPGAHVLHDVPVDARLVRAAQVGEPEPEREVDRPVDLLVEIDVPHVAGDARIASDPQLVYAARALVPVERPEQALLPAVGRRVD